MSSVRPPFLKSKHHREVEMNRNDVYTMLDKALWLRSPVSSMQESGMTLMYRPGKVIGRTYNPEISTTLDQLAAWQRRLLGLSGYFHMVNWTTSYTEQVRKVMSSETTDLLFFEGFAFDEDNEGYCHLNPLRQSNIVLSEPGSSNRWADKGYFRDKVRRKYNSNVTPPSKHMQTLNTQVLKCFVDEIFDQGYGRIIIKVPGTGGLGNTIITRESTIYPRWMEQFPKDKPMMVEAYVDWLISPCTSFFCWQGEVVFMEMCEQILRPKTAGFIGGRSFGFLSTLDISALCEFQRPIAEEAHREGIKGFLGIDTILRKPLHGDELILPDSGLAVLFIEMNPRLNGHNQERYAIHRIAQHRGIEPHDVSHLRVGTKPMTNTVDAWSAREKMEEILSGFASPLLPESELDAGKVFFIPAENHGELRPSVLYDGIMFFGKEAEEGILSAYKYLTELQLTKG